MSRTRSAATIIEGGDISNLFMLPGMPFPEEGLQLDSAGDNSRVVRFDNECVLIPESAKEKRGLVLTKSYSLPLWKRKGQQLSDSDLEDSTRSSARSPSPEDSRVVIKVPIPTFRRRSSRSPTRGRSVSSSPVVPNKLPPCLVHRSPSMSPILSKGLPLSPIRRPSLSNHHRRKDEITVPLRACCQACEKITEECLKEGESWQEKFSRGAKRRRSASLDQQDPTARPKISTHMRSLSLSKEFSALSMDVNEALERELDAAAAITSSGMSARFNGTSTFALTVDEVDKRRKSYDFSKEYDIRHQLQGLSQPSPDRFSPPGSPHSSGIRYPRDREVSTSSTMSSTSATDDHNRELMPDILDPRHRLRSSPIEEEDEAQLFPLPRRSPSGTPSPKVSPAGTPNGSTSYLPGLTSAYAAGSCGGGALTKRSPSGSASSSKENISSSSQESVLRASLSRKPPSGVGIGFASGGTHLMVPSSTSSSRTTSPTPSTKNTLASSRVSTHGLNIPTAPTAEERAAMSPTSPKGPRRSRTRPSTVEEKMPTPPPEPSIPKTATETPSKSSSPTIPSPSPALSQQNKKPTTHTTNGFHMHSPFHIPLHHTHSSPSSEAVTSSSPPTSFNFRSSSPTPTSPPPLRLNTNTNTPSQSLTTPIPIPGSSHSKSHTLTPSSPQPPPQSPHKRKLSFTAPFIKAGGAIRGVSADVLKGVSSMGGTGVV